MQHNSLSGQCLYFVVNFSKFKQFDLSQFLNSLFGIVTESVEFYCLTHVGNDRFCSVFRSELVPPFLESWSFFFDLQVLHFVEFFEF